VFHGYEFALVICRNPLNGKFLAIDETKERGWWIPGGGVDAGENFREAAIRECKEEASIDISIKGILKIEHDLLEDTNFKMRVIFYAEPINPHQNPKSIPDDDSNCAEWLTIEEFAGKPHTRGPELIEFGKQVEEGNIFPLSVFD